MTGELKKHVLRPGGLVDLFFFLSGVALGFAGPFALELRDVPVAVRHRTLSGGSVVFAFAFWIMPVVFGVFQSRHGRQGHLSLRRPALLGSLLIGLVAGLAYYFVTRIGTMWSVLVPAVILPWCASRALWTTNHNPSKPRSAGR